MYLSHGWRHQNWRVAIVGQSLFGSLIGFFCVLFLGLFVVNLAGWLFLIAACLMALGALLRGLGG
jgi:hypothetical protein